MLYFTELVFLLIFVLSYLALTVSLELLRGSSTWRISSLTRFLN